MSSSLCWSWCCVQHLLPGCQRLLTGQALGDGSVILDFSFCNYIREGNTKGSLSERRGSFGVRSWLVWMGLSSWRGRAFSLVLPSWLTVMKCLVGQVCWVLQVDSWGFWCKWSNRFWLVGRSQGCFSGLKVRDSFSRWSLLSLNHMNGRVKPIFLGSFGWRSFHALWKYLFRQKKSSIHRMVLFSVVPHILGRIIGPKAGIFMPTCAHVLSRRSNVNHGKVYKLGRPNYFWIG